MSSQGKQTLFKTIQFLFLPLVAPTQRNCYWNTSPCLRLSKIPDSTLIHSLFHLCLCLTSSVTLKIDHLLSSNKQQRGKRAMCGPVTVQLTAPPFPIYKIYKKLSPKSSIISLLIEKYTIIICQNLFALWTKTLHLFLSSFFFFLD